MSLQRIKRLSELFCAAAIVYYSCARSCRHKRCEQILQEDIHNYV